MSSLKKNFAYQITYQMLIVILPLITSPYLSRVLGSQGLGEYSYSYSIAYYFSLFVLLGVNNHGTREIAKVKGDIKKTSEVFWAIYILQLIAGGGMLVLYAISQIFLREKNTLALIQSLYVISSILDINWLFFGLEKFKVTVTRNCIVKILTVFCIFIFVKSSKDVVIYTFIMAMSFLVSQMVLWPFTRGSIKYTKVSRQAILQNVKPLLILFIPVVAVSIFKYMDKIMLGAMYSKRELGLYDNTEKIVSIPTGVITAVGVVMLPRISNLLAKNSDHKAVMKYIQLSMSGSMMVASVMAFGLAGVSTTFSVWFWGEEFTRCGDLIKAIAVTVIFLSWANVIRTQYLIPQNKEQIFVNATIYGAIINFIINYVLIRQHGALGTVIGTVVAEFVVALYQTIKCRKELPILIYLKESVPYFVAGTIMYIGIQLVSKLVLNNFILLVIEVCVGILIYIVIMFVYFVFVKKVDPRNICELMRK